MSLSAEESTRLSALKERLVSANLLKSTGKICTVADISSVRSAASDQNIYELTKDDMNLIMEGALFFGSGGGGGRSMALDYLSGVNPNSRTLLVHPGVMDQNATAVVACGIGEPSASIKDNPVALQAPKKAVELVLKDVNHSSFQLAIGSVESGGVSMLIAALVASQLSEESKWLAVLLNGDGAGRAVPEMTMLRYNQVGPKFPGVPVSPLELVNNTCDWNQELPGLDSAADAEAAIRPLLAAHGGMLSMGCWPSTVKKYSELIVQSTFTRCLALGKQFAAGVMPLNELLNEVNGVTLFRGFCLSMDTVASGGFDHGKATFSSFPGTWGIFNVQNLNENVMASFEGSSSPVMVAPELISYYDITGGTSFSNVEVPDYCFTTKDKNGNTVRGKYWDHEVAVISSPVDAGVWDRPDILEAWKSMLKQYFNYDGPLKPSDPAALREKVEEHRKAAEAIAAQREENQKKSGAVAPLAEEPAAAAAEK